MLRKIFFSCDGSPQIFTQDAFHFCFFPTLCPVLNQPEMLKCSRGKRKITFLDKQVIRSKGLMKIILNQQSTSRLYRFNGTTWTLHQALCGVTVLMLLRALPKTQQENVSGGRNHLNYTEGTWRKAVFSCNNLVI